MLRIRVAAQQGYEKVGQVQRVVSPPDVPDKVGAYAELIRCTPDKIIDLGVYDKKREVYA